MIERVVRNDEVVGLIPICSTNLPSESDGKLPAKALATAGLRAAGYRALPLSSR